MSTPDNEREIDAVSGVETTGHEWDGIKELNNPLPRWWLWIFYACIIWAVIYMVFMPAIPGLPGAEGATRGLRNHSERVNVARDMAALEEARSVYFSRLTEADLSEIESDPELLTIALAAGESAFGDNCATCHGAGAQGARGYPNLNDDVWLWGGTLEEIRRTIRYGIRSEHMETRMGDMPAFGRDELLSREEVNDVAEYVLSLSGHSEDAAAVDRGAETFAAQCAVCHGDNAMGNRDLGAPNLTDTDWLYGGDRETVRETIWSARNSTMPAWESRLDDAVITALAVYVHSRGGGEED